MPKRNILLALWDRSSAGEHFLHTEGVTSSILVGLIIVERHPILWCLSFFPAVAFDCYLFFQGEDVYFGESENFFRCMLLQSVQDVLLVVSFE